MPSIFDRVTGRGQNKVRFCVPRKNGDKSECIDLLDIDATLSEDHSSQVEISDTAIEDGSIITDHIEVAPREIRVECVVSNNPLSLRQAIIGNAAGLVGSVIGRSAQSNIAGAIAVGGLATIGNALVRNVNNEGNRAKSALDTLRAAQEGGTPISVITRVATYQNMILRDLQVNRTVQTSEVLRFTASLREIRIVTSAVEKVDKQAVVRDRQNTAPDKVDKGRQQAGDATPQITDRARDAVSKGIGGAVLKNVANLFGG